MADELGPTYRVQPNLGVGDQERRRKDLADQLRENLKKRKAQRRQRAAHEDIHDEVVIDGQVQNSAGEGGSSPAEGEEEAEVPRGKPDHLADFEV